MKKAVLISLAILLLTVTFASAQQLSIGKTAPEIKVAQWIKGDAIDKLDPNKIYVVEFWATWCGPCRTTIPHISELAVKYQDKVSFIGVSVWEQQTDDKDTAYLGKVKEFVDSMGDQMTYNIAADTPEHFMGEAWMTAAGLDGIPAAFVIGKQNRILWIGHPMDPKMGETIDAALADDFNLEKFYLSARREINKSEIERFKRLMTRVDQLVQFKRYEAALALLDKVIKQNPTWESSLRSGRFNLLLQANELEAYRWGREFLAQVTPQDFPFLLQMGVTIVKQPELKNRDIPLATDMLTKADELTGKLHPSVPDAMSYVYEQSGDMNNALLSLQDAIKRAQALPDQAIEDKAGLIQYLQSRLEQLKNPPGQ